MEALREEHRQEVRCLEKEKKLLTLTRNAFIVSCFQTRDDLWVLQGENEELEDTVEGLKQAMA
ncbi:hypothetical protein A2U01_0112143, partial [Trifolium medium]|nr:hypothetical protein [Trifolium medium]